MDHHVIDNLCSARLHVYLYLWLGIHLFFDKTEIKVNVGVLLTDFCDATIFYITEDVDTFS